MKHLIVANNQRPIDAQQVRIYTEKEEFVLIISGDELRILPTVTNILSGETKADLFLLPRRTNETR